MKRVISFFLCVIMLMLSTYTALAKETTDISYNTLSVEFSDNLGTTEELNVMVTEEHLYVDAEQLGDRLGYQINIYHYFLIYPYKYLRYFFVAFQCAPDYQAQHQNYLIIKD